jgi:hypothetical protein
MRPLWIWIAALLTCVAVTTQDGASARDLPIQGGPGGGPFRLDCPAGAFITGIALRSGGWIDAVQGSCRLFLTNRNLLASGTSATAVTGGPGGGSQQAGCTPDRYVAGIRIGYTRDGDHPKYLDYVELSCAVLSGYGGETKVCLQTGDNCWDRHPGDDKGGLSFQARCAPGEMVSALIGRSGQFIDALGIACAARPPLQAAAPPNPPLRPPPVLVTLPGKLDAAFRTWLGANGITNASLAVMQNGALIASFGYGARTPQQPVAVASLSKAITGICISTLVDNGQLAYSDTIGARLASYFAANPPRDPAARGITIEQLLRQRSGIGLDSTQRQGYTNSVNADQDIVRAALALSLASVPGSQYVYNNVNYALLGMVIKAVTSRDYGEYCQTMLRGRGSPDAHVGAGLLGMSAFGGWEISPIEYLNFARGFDRMQRMLSPATFALINGGPAEGNSRYVFGEVITPVANGLKFDHVGNWQANWTTPSQMGAYFALWENQISVAATYDRGIEAGSLADMLSAAAH